MKRRIKSGQELSDLTADIRARYAVREYVQSDTGWLRMLINTLIFAALVAGENYILWESLWRP